MTDNRICEICGLTIATKEHEIFGGSPTFHGFVDSGRRLATLPISGLEAPGEVVPPAVRDWRAAIDEENARRLEVRNWYGLGPFES